MSSLNQTTLNNQKTADTIHIPVLMNEVIEMLNIRPGISVLDGTVGEFGHGLEICKIIGEGGHYVGCDLDPKSIEKAKKIASKNKLKSTICFLNTNFADSKKIKTRCKTEGFDAILLDLGWNMSQFEDASRGFSFRKKGILNMRYDQKPQRLTAWDIVNTADQYTLTEIIKEYGDEPEKLAKIIASRIVQNRPIHTTQKLADVVTSAISRYYRNKKIHPATKTFQALRIAVNDEINNLKKFLNTVDDLLLPGGRLAVISFHSGEDRSVKHTFRSMVRSGKYEYVNKKPIVPTDREIESNPRSRSAKLRVIQRVE